MKEQGKREYCFHCRRWLDGDTCRIDILKNRHFCSLWCALHADSHDTIEATRVKTPEPKAKPESAPTQQPLAVPDIYLAELVGLIRRALQADGLTERLWTILDDWCDNQESYLEKAYPEAHEQAESRESVTVDWRGGVAERLRNDIFGSYNAAMKEVANAKAGEFLGLDTFIRTGYHNVSVQVDGVDIPELGPISPEEYEKLRGYGLVGPAFPSFLIPESPPVDDPDVAKNLAMRLGSYPTRRNYEVSEPTTPNAFVVSVNGVEVPRGAICYRDEADGINTDCTCQAFQGDNPTCAFHGEGTAWYDLHGGE